MGGAVDHQPLDLMEHRRVRRVVVAAEGAAGHDDADRRLLRQHRADLHRRGVGAQHQPRAVGALRQIERVVLLARRMLGRDVERGEIVEIVLDMRALGDGETHLAEDRDDLVDGLADRMDAALVPANGTGRVTSARSAAEPLSTARRGRALAASVKRRGDRVLSGVQPGAGIAALRPEVERAEAPHRQGQRPVAAEHT